MTAQWWCQATLPSSQKQQDTTFCQGKAPSHCSRRTHKITLISPVRSVRMGSKHNVRASILASSLSEVNLELHSSRASHSTGPPSLVLHSSRWQISSNKRSLSLHSVNPGGHARKFSVGLFRAFLKVQMSSPECNYVSYEVPSHRGAHQAP